MKNTIRSFSRTLITILLCLCHYNLSGQIVILSDMNKYQNVRLRMTLQDKETKEPIPFATLYLIPDGDTTITHFGLTDEAGDVTIKDIPSGKYLVNAEMIGYKAYRKVHNLNGWQNDLGIIKLEQDLQLLETAVVTAAGNPILVQNDTLVYNAAAYRVGENAVLEDLLKKMPGMEVSDDGTVKVNGEQVDKITVGGKTFFFNDPSAALKNLPAKIVDKIKVIDKESKEAEFTGISSGQEKEKVMDVALKEEYTEGWFGNAKLAGGYDLTRSNEEQLKINRGLLYNGNAMITAYTEKDQVVLIANAQNVNESQSYAYISYGSMSPDAYSQLRGVGTGSQVGLNYNTERIKGFTTSVATTYKHNTQDDRRRSYRTAYQADGNPLQTDTYKEGIGEQQSASINFEIEKKDQSRWNLFLMGRLSYTDNEVHARNENETRDPLQTLNTSLSNTHSARQALDNFGFLTAGYRFKNERRNLSLQFSYDYSLGNTDKDETTLLKYGTQDELQELRYKVDQYRLNLRGQLSYVEPLGEKWALNLLYAVSTTGNRETSDATHPDGTPNAYYSSFTHGHYVSHEPHLLIQYQDPKHNLQAGVSNNILLNEIHSRSMGVDNLAGQNEWLSNWSPFINYSYHKNTTRINVYYQGNSNPVSASESSPTLDLNNRVQIQMGNVYLRPHFGNIINGNYNWNNRETFTFINVNAFCRMDFRPVVYASWFDEQGVRYAVPVNAELPSVHTNLYLNINQPLGHERKFTLSAEGSTSWTRNNSYQATRRLAGLDIESFNYFAFMQEFWGEDNSGENFYNGTSGFQESKTQEISWSAKVGLRYNLLQWSLNASWRTLNTRSFYTLDPTANNNTWNHSLNGSALYQPGNNWEMETEVTYKMFRGYANGYGDPELTWNASIRKSIGKWTLALNAYDLLNQTRNLSRSISAEYWEDTYRYRQGRYISFSVSLNFGKTTAASNNSVQNAMWRML